MKKAQGVDDQSPIRYLVESKRMGDRQGRSLVATRGIVLVVDHGDGRLSLTMNETRAQRGIGTRTDSGIYILF